MIACATRHDPYWLLTVICEPVWVWTV